ncbi:diacylglycerol kinase family protein [Janibacter alkaliphilus]|uniref:Diacylglycerol kinase family enzyme n=1 Tax=Janibacter alkaliphilus TaxID=1069963 RepID=A0A852XE67_9MICO|nr:diacylglycerol kinase family enzyme [Janibacter alkaliphilus]
MSLGVVVNPASRRAAAAMTALRAVAAETGWGEPMVHETAVDATGTGQARQCVRDGARRVVVVGGDGTTRAVAHGLAGSRVPMGIVPAGTANLYAHNLRLPLRDLTGAAWRALTGPARPADLGLARWRDEDGRWSREHPFLVMAGLGRDAETVARTSEEAKARVGWLAYFAPAGRAALRRPLPVRLSVDDGPERELAAWSVIAANCGVVRAGITIAHQARHDDGLLDLMEVTVRRPDQWLPLAAKGVLRLPGRVPGLRHEQAREVQVRLEQGTVAAQLDGDVVARVTALASRVEAGVLDVVGAVSTPG